MIQMRTEERPFEMSNRRSRMGRSTVDVACPFCDALIIVYIWSFHGCGKKLCQCGAALHRDGVARKLVKQADPTEAASVSVTSSPPKVKAAKLNRGERRLKELTR